METEYENIVLVKNEVFVFRIPPRQSNRGYRAADWTLDNPDWTGRLRVATKAKELYIKLEDRNTGDLFAKCPVDAHPGMAVEPVTDSSRYFVLRIQDDNGRTAFIGIGFADRGDSFDLNVAIQDHFKWLKQEAEADKASQNIQSGPLLDLGFKAGQTIKLNLNTRREGDDEATGKSKKRPSAGNLGAGAGLLPPPPPPGGSRIRQPAPQQHASTEGGSDFNILGDLIAPPSSSSSYPEPPSGGDSMWGDFSGGAFPAAARQQQTTTTTPANNNWTGFM